MTTSVFAHLTEVLGDCAYVQENGSFHRVVEMYHASTDADSKQRISSDFAKSDGYIKCLVATISFGMGIQIEDVDLVLNWGPPNTVLTYWQEVGRCARDGRTGYALLLSCPISGKSNIEPAMKNVSSPTSQDCLRQLILNHMKIKGMADIDLPGCNEACTDIIEKCKCPKCLCCSVCREACPAVSKETLKSFMNS